MTNKKICVIGRKNLESPNGLTNSSKLLFDGLKSINIGPTQFIEIKQIYNNFDLLCMFDFIFFDELIVNGSDNILEFMAKLKSKNNNMRIIQTNHGFWYNSKYNDIIDLKLSVYPKIIKKIQSNNNENPKRIFKYIFQVPDIFYQFNKNEDRSERIISIQKFSERSFDFDLFYNIYTKSKLEIDFIGHFIDNSPSYVSKINSFFEKTKNRFKIIGSKIKRQYIPMILNKYKYYLLGSKDYLCPISQIEQIRCGCKPFLFNKKYNNEIELIDNENFITFDDFYDFNNKFKMYQNKKEHDPLQLSSKSKMFTIEEYNRRLDFIFIKELYNYGNTIKELLKK